MYNTITLHVTESANEWHISAERIESLFFDKKRGEVFVRMYSNDGYYVKESLEQIRELINAACDGQDDYESINDSLSSIESQLHKTVQALVEMLIEFYKGHNPKMPVDELAEYIRQAHTITR